VTAQLLGHIASPALVLDRDRRVVACNDAMASLLGEAREGLGGRAWSSVAERVPAGMQVPFGADGETLVVVDAPRASFEPCATLREYVVSLRKEELGVVTEYKSGPMRAGDVVGRKCHDAFWQRAGRCRHCPVLEPEQDQGSMRAAVIGTAADGSYLVAVGQREAASDRARVRVHGVKSEIVAQFLDARLEHVSASAKLSQREREVLRLLMLGRALGEIAATLGISVRTAKYHQSNVLEKIGVDSRLDLLRLVF
jgi:DNA-binding CsgD family transcriptional regulator